MVKIPKAPTGSRPAGRRLWRAVLAEFDLDEHELSLLRQAVAVADVCEDLQALVERTGRWSRPGWVSGGRIRRWWSCGSSGSC